jgi:chromosome segregation ATPase
MSRPTIATPTEVRTAVLALLASAGSGDAPSRQTFRRAVSVRKVRERLGGGNPATIGRAINALETELVQAGMESVALPELPAEIAELMTRLWKAAIGVQLDDLSRLRSEAQAVADGAREQLNEAQLRAQMLQQELAELRAVLNDRDARLAQATTDGAALHQQVLDLRATLDEALGREAQALAAHADLLHAQTTAIAAAREQYEGLSKQLLLETAQQRQAAQAEVNRMVSQQKFADRREEALQGRVSQLEQDLAKARSEREHALGEASALRYVNTSLRSQVDEIVRGLPMAAPPPVSRSARGKKTASKGSTAKEDLSK